MNKIRGILIVVLLLCLTISAVSACSSCGTIQSVKSVCPEEICLDGSGCLPDETTVTIEVTGFGDCWCCSPYNVKLVEVTESYIVDEADFSIAPDSVVENGDGTTTIIWRNIGQYVGNKNRFLDASETFVVTFSAGSNTLGDDMAVDTGDAVIKYKFWCKRKTVPVDQAYIDVVRCTPPSVPEFPTLAVPLALIVGLSGVLFVLRQKYLTFSQHSIERK